MDYNFECKNIGVISALALSQLQAFALEQNYSVRYSWVISDAGVLTEEHGAIKMILDEIKKFVSVGNLVDATINILPSMSCIPEHSDRVISRTVNTNHKIHIPLITNDSIGMMWPGNDTGKNPFVTIMKEGNIYIYNNIAKHSAVNLSSSDRYHLVLEFDNLVCAE